ncbi:hypothetical protein R6Q59_020805 [Mikania micrantha]
MVTLPGTLPVGPTIQSGTEPVTELEINLERPGINEIDAEVDATIQVCESVGIDLGNFKEQVLSVIDGEGGLYESY